MKNIKKLLVWTGDLLLGWVGDFLVLVFGIFAVFFVEGLISEMQGLPIFSLERVLASAPTTVVWLVVFFLARLLMYLQFPTTYKSFLIRKGKNGNKTLWEDLPKTHQFWSLQFRFALYVLAWVTIYQPL